MMFGQKTALLFFLEVSLAILPGFVYGFPINTVDFPAIPQVDNEHIIPGHLENIVTETVLQVGGVNVLPQKLEVTDSKKLTSSVPAELILQVDDVNVPTESITVPATIPQVDKVQVIVTDELLDKEFPIVPVKLQSQVGVGLQEKLEKTVSEQQLPVIPVETTSHVNNTNLLLKKLEEVDHEKHQPLVVLTSILHLHKVQVLIPEKVISEKLPAELKPQDGVVEFPEKLEEIVPEQLSLVFVDSLPQVKNVNELTEKLDEVVGETLHPLAVIASIPQIGNVQLVFSEELLKNILSKKSTSLVPNESKSKVEDVFENVVNNFVDNIIPEELDSVVPKSSQPLAVVASIPHVGNVQLIFSGELLDKIISKEPLPLVHIEPKPQISGITLLPASLEEIVTVKPVSPIPTESTPQLEEIVLETHKPLDVIPSILQVGNVEATLSEKILDKISSQKPILQIPVRSNSEGSNVITVPEVVEKIENKKPLSVVPISQEDDADIQIPVKVPSGVANENVNEVPAVTPTQLSTHEELTNANKE